MFSLSAYLVIFLWAICSVPKFNLTLFRILWWGELRVLPWFPQVRYCTMKYQCAEKTYAEEYLSGWAIFNSAPKKLTSSRVFYFRLASFCSTLFTGHITLAKTLINKETRNKKPKMFAPFRLKSKPSQFLVKWATSNKQVNGKYFRILHNCADLFDQFLPNWG